MFCFMELKKKVKSLPYFFDLILEIASNDGSLLHFSIKKKYKCFVLNSQGVDPAKNLKSVAEKKKVKSLPQKVLF